MKELVNEYLEALSIADVSLDKIKKHLKDDTINLNIRWESYLKVEDRLGISIFYTNIPTMDGKEITYYDDLYCDRHQTISYSEIVERLSGHSEEALDYLKKYLLQEGYGGCKNDW